MADNRDVHDDSKQTTLPIARAIVQAYVTDGRKLPWHIDLLNLNLNNHDLPVVEQRIARYAAAYLAMVRESLAILTSRHSGLLSNTRSLVNIIFTC